MFLVGVEFRTDLFRERIRSAAVPLLLIAVVVLVVACLGKGVACWAAACLNGEDHRTGMAVGTLMNARGLMELIVLNIGSPARDRPGRRCSRSWF